MTLVMLVLIFNIFSAIAQKPARPTRRHPAAVTDVPAAQMPDTIPLTNAVRPGSEVVEDEFTLTPADTLQFIPVDSAAIVNSPSMDLFEPGTVTTQAPDSTRKVFIPDPTRAVWFSALCPGLGQIYNRRYWKLPIVIGGFMGLGYATSWNNRMLNDYTQAYRDLMDNDPSTKSYMDFFPPTTTEDSLNRDWLERVLKSRKDYFRRNRDLCIICMVGVYLIAMVDAYVDASLSHFDISPDLTMDVYPTLIPDTRNSRVGIGLQWALNF